MNNNFPEHPIEEKIIELKGEARNILEDEKKEEYVETALEKTLKNINKLSKYREEVDKKDPRQCLEVNDKL